MADNDDGVKIHIDGKTYDLEDFEGREIIDAEKAFDISLLGEISRGSMMGIYAAVFMVKRRQNPAVLVEEVLALKLSDVMKLSEEKQGPPPKPRAKKAA